MGLDKHAYGFEERAQEGELILAFCLGDDLPTAEVDLRSTAPQEQGGFGF